MLFKNSIILIYSEIIILVTHSLQLGNLIS